MAEVRVAPESIRAGDRIVFVNPDTGKRVSREVVEVDDKGSSYVYVFQAGRGRFKYLVPKDGEVLLQTRRGAASRYVLA